MYSRMATTGCNRTELSVNQSRWRRPGSRPGQAIAVSNESHVNGDCDTWRTGTYFIDGGNLNVQGRRT